MQRLVPKRLARGGSILMSSHLVQQVYHHRVSACTSPSNRRLIASKPDYWLLRSKWMRGGTSKGLFVLRSWLRGNDKGGGKGGNGGGEVDDAVFAAALGSRDRYGRQLDGMGGGTSSTSKIAIIEATNEHECDVLYRFGQVSVSEERVDYSGTCGNLAAAVGVFAIEEGIVRAAAGSDSVCVRVWESNRGGVIRVTVPVSKQDGMPMCCGDVQMPGVHQSGAGVAVEFVSPGPEGVALPTGQPRETLDVDGGVRVTLVDAGNPLVVVVGKDLGLTGAESREELLSREGLSNTLERIRAAGAVRMGLDGGRGAEWVTENRKATPKVAWVCPPVDYIDSGGGQVLAPDCDLVGRVVSMGVVHQAFTGTGALAIAVAAAIPGTVVSEVCGTCVKDRPLRLGHTAGCMHVFASVRKSQGAQGEAGRYYTESAGFVRTARTLMEGFVRIPHRGEGLGMEENFVRGGRD